MNQHYLCLVGIILDPLERQDLFVIVPFEEAAHHALMPSSATEIGAAASGLHGGSLFCPKLYNQRLLCPRNESQLVVPRRIRLRTELYIEIPNHARKRKADFEVPEAGS